MKTIKLDKIELKELRGKRSHVHVGVIAYYVHM